VSVLAYDPENRESGIRTRPSSLASRFHICRPPVLVGLAAPPHSPASFIHSRPGAPLQGTVCNPLCSIASGTLPGKPQVLFPVFYEAFMSGSMHP